MNPFESFAIIYIIAITGTFLCYKITKSYWYKKETYIGFSLIITGILMAITLLPVENLAILIFAGFIIAIGITILFIVSHYSYPLANYD